MPDEAPWDRLAQHLQALTGATGEMAREVRALVQGLASDRAVFRETLRELSGFVATAGLEMQQLTRQVTRVAETTETGFTQLRTLMAENNRQILENNSLIRRLLDILARGRGDGQGMPQE